jgi:hypothetical protein
VDPRPFSFRQLSWMSRGRDEAAWLIARSQTIILRGCWVGKDDPEFPDAAMNPYYRRPKRTKADRKRGMADMVEIIEAQFGPKRGK